MVDGFANYNGNQPMMVARKLLAVARDAKLVGRKELGKALDHLYVTNKDEMIFLLFDLQAIWKGL